MPLPDDLSPPSPAPSRRPLRGWGFPVGPSASGSLLAVTGEDVLARSIRLVVLTRPGERVMLPGFGCRAHALLYRPLTPAALDAVAWHVEDAVRRHEPRVEVLSVKATRPAGRAGAVRVDLLYRAKASGREVALQLDLDSDSGSNPEGPR